MNCEICGVDPAKLFAVVQDGPKVAKAHVCPDCFEILILQLGRGTVTEVCQQDYNDTVVTAHPAPRIEDQ
jgi:ribosome-binding protein aMBF1 (putative translation factor)